MAKSLFASSTPQKAELPRLQQNASRQAGAVAKKWNYDVTLDDDLKSARVRLCFESPQTQGLRSGDPAVDVLISFKRDSSKRCVSYRASLEGGGTRFIRGNSKTKLVSPDVLFVRPNRWLKDPDISVRFHHSKSVNISVPYTQIGDGLYRLTTSCLRRRGVMVFGEFKRETLHVGESELDIVVYGEEEGVSVERLKRWLRKSAQASASLYGEFPRERVQVTVSKSRGSGVHWGEVVRGGPPSVHFIVGEATSARVLDDDWVGTHELSHLALPLVTRDGPWLYEGFATYAQNMLRARSGAMSAQKAFQKMHEGFERGIADDNNGDLAFASANLRKINAWMQVYWGGTAIIFLTDVAMRKDGKSLDVALNKLRDCCFDTERKYEPLELVREIDRAHGSKVMEPIVERALKQKFVDLSRVYNELGIVVTSGKVTFDDDAPFANIRRDIVRPFESDETKGGEKSNH